MTARESAAPGDIAFEWWTCSDKDSFTVESEASEACRKKVQNTLPSAETPDVPATPHPGLTGVGEDCGHSVGGMSAKLADFAFRRA